MQEDNIRSASDKPDNPEDDAEANEVIESYEKLPDEQKLMVARSISITKSGPLPDPNDFALYEKVLPGAADRIVCMAENQAMHRQNLEQSIEKHNFRLEIMGIVAALLISSICMAGGVFLLYFEKSLAGFASLLVGVAPIVGSLVIRGKGK